MRVCILNGSPKGRNSITLQTCRYLAEKFPEDSFCELDVGQKIRHYEGHMEEALSVIRKADLLLFSYPVYTFLLPSQLQRFVELLKDSGEDLSGKYASQLTTSKHFYDITAHRFLEENCRDMKLKVIRGLSADMEDLLTAEGRAEAEAFWKYVHFCAGSRTEGPDGKEKKNYDTVLVGDFSNGKNLQALVHTFTKAYPYPVRIVDLSEVPLQGGCLGCFHCASDGTCIYKDGFDRFLREKIQSADAILYAFTISGHGMGTRFKMYDDRQFCNGHRTVTQGKPIAYLADGDYPQEENLRTLLEARSEVGHNFLAGVGYDEATAGQTARELAYALENDFEQPRNFYGVGGMKIFRDLIWQMQGLMKADHNYYKEHGLYDFPQKHPEKMLLMEVLGAAVRNPKINAKMGNKMTEGMLAPYEKVVRKAKKEQEKKS